MLQHESVYSITWHNEKPNEMKINVLVTRTGCGDFCFVRHFPFKYIYEAYMSVYIATTNECNPYVSRVYFILDMRIWYDGKGNYLFQMSCVYVYEDGVYDIQQTETVLTISSFFYPWAMNRSFQSKEILLFYGFSFCGTGIVSATVLPFVCAKCFFFRRSVIYTYRETLF